MEASPAIDTVTYPGGYDVAELIAAVKLAALRHVPDLRFG